MPDMPKGTERPEVNQTTGAIDQTSEQHPFTAAERISKALRKRKQRNQIRRMAGKYLGTAIMVTALILAVVVVYLPSSQQPTSAMRQRQATPAFWQI